MTRKEDTKQHEQMDDVIELASQQLNCYVTLLRTYSKSQFVDYIAKSGGGLIDTLGGYTHYEVVTMNQIIDVAATREPEIELLRQRG